MVELYFNCQRIIPATTICGFVTSRLNMQYSVEKLLEYFVTIISLSNRLYGELVRGELAAHIPEQLQLGLCMLVGVVMGSAGPQARDASAPSRRRRQR